MKLNFERFIKQVIKDVKIELDDEFDRNFERKAFFDIPWAATKIPVNKGSLMIRTGALRSSIKSSESGNKINYTSSHPAAALHNEGGILTVTPKMKKFFWAMYYQLTGSLAKRQDGRNRNTIRNRAISQEALNWKYLALMKVGTQMKIPQRQFIGHHPRVDELIRAVIKDNVQEIEKQITDQLRSFGKK